MNTKYLFGGALVIGSVVVFWLFLNGRISVDSPFAIAVLWPLAFAVLEVIFNSFTSGRFREGNRKFVLSYKERGSLLDLAPLDLDQLRSELNKHRNVQDIDILGSGFWETSLGVDLCLAAISADLVNIFVLLNGVSQPYETLQTLLRTSFFVLAVEFSAVALVAYFLRHSVNYEEPNEQIFLVQFTNIIGLVTMYMSFVILGSILTQ